MKFSLWFLIFLLSSCSHVSIERQKTHEGELAIKKAQTLYDLGEVDASISTLQLLVDNNAYDSSHDLAYELLIKRLLELKRLKEAKKIASYFLAHHQDSPSADRIIKLFDETEPESLKDTNDLPEPLEKKTGFDEELQMEDSIFESKRSDEAPQSEIDKSLEVDKKTLGILLPLTGTYAPFAKKILTAMGIALKPLNPNGSDIQVVNLADMKIVIADTKGEAQKASLQARSLILDHKVSMLIGEITTEASLASALMAKQFSVPMLTLSRHQSLTNLGKYIFVFNSTPNHQMEYLVDHALKAGHKKFGILYPKHGYGMSMSQLFFDEVTKKGGQVTALENYEPQDNTFSEPVKKLVGTFYQEQPVVDFDALFIPDFQKLSLVVPALVAEDILVSNNPTHMKAFAVTLKTEPKYVQLLGPDSWNDKSLLKKVSPHIEGAYFVDSISFEQNEGLKNFAENFLNLAGTAPTALEVFAHDAALLAHHLIKNNDGDREQLQQSIAQINQKVGLLDRISFLPNGELDAPKIGFSIKDGAAINDGDNS